MVVTNEEFIAAIFGEDAPWCHVTDFMYDPGAIPKDQHLIAWKGDYFSRYTLREGSNQYFTISTFYCDEKQQARRRKALYRRTPCIVLDDVKEKLSMEEVGKLPAPSWILETSAGSEQWGYILNTPCEDRGRVENLLDGLVANGLAPQGKDPGMKGVTRYVRLPGGSNSKASRLIDGRPFKCRLTLWQPFTTVTMEDLAAPFFVNLDAPRRESRVDGAGDVSDHPLINIPEIIHVKEIRSEGRFDILCPWVDGHTGADDSGAAVFTNTDGSIGFKCHHGSCQERTGRHLLQYIEGQSPGFGSQLKNWQIMREFGGDIAPPAASFLDPVPDVSFLDPVPTAAPAAPAPPPREASTPLPREGASPDAIQMMVDALYRQPPGSAESRAAAGIALKHVDDLPKMDRNHWHLLIADAMRWTKPDMREILKDLRATWYAEQRKDVHFYESAVFVKELNQFYDQKSRIFFSPEAFQNSFSEEDAEARAEALQGGRVKKVDRLDYAPMKPKIFSEGSLVMGNMWSDIDQPTGIPGDISPWLEHFSHMGWGKHRDHIVKWMAFTLQHPDIKINHMLILGGREGVGKDFLLYPLIKGMGENCTVISGEELLDGFDEYLLSTKYLHINEAELGDRKEATQVSNKLKPIAAAPPDTLSVNQKGIKRIKVRNIVNGTMTTNSKMPLKLNGPSRRFYGVWSELTTRDRGGETTPYWREYWDRMWPWMRDGGWAHVLFHLKNDVDLSDFNPREAPALTDFMRDIQDESKPPLQVTLEGLIDRGEGLFASDIFAIDDLLRELMDMQARDPASVDGDARWLTARNVASALSGVYGVVPRRTSARRLYVVRDAVKYSHLGPAELLREYERAIAAARAAVAQQRATLSVVN